MILTKLIKNRGGVKNNLSFSLLKHLSLVGATTIGIVGLSLSTATMAKASTPTRDTVRFPVRLPEWLCIKFDCNVLLPSLSDGGYLFSTAPISLVRLGDTPASSLLPTRTLTDGTSSPRPIFAFDDISIGNNGLGTNQHIFIDPDVATGYDYTVTGGPLFASVLIPDPLPQGDSNFTLELGSFGNFSLVAGTSFNLLNINPSGFNGFRISGIDPNELLDPNNTTAFITGLTFTGAGTVNITQTPIVQNVPEPTSPLNLIALGFLGASLRLRNNMKQKSSTQNLK